jgi:hypothetical protein
MMQEKSKSISAIKPTSRLESPPALLARAAGLPLVPLVATFTKMGAMDLTHFTIDGTDRKPKRDLSPWVGAQGTIKD